MDHLEGQTLSHYLGLYVDSDQVLRARYPLTTTAAMTLLQALLEALEVLHEASPEPVYHRDITPNNLFLENGHLTGLRLLDFGLAHRGERQLMSSTSIGVGTPSYAAPEQVQIDSSTSIGPHTDLYALGSVLYTALSGRAPLPVYNRLMGIPLTPIRDWMPGLNPLLAGVIDACLQLEAARRPQSVQAIRCQLAMTIPPVSPDVIPNTAPGTVPNTTLKVELKPKSEPKSPGFSFKWAGPSSGLLAGLIILAAWQYNDIQDPVIPIPKDNPEKKPKQVTEQPVAKPDSFLYLPDLTTEQIKALQLASAQKLGLPVTFRDSLSDGSQGPEMVVIPAGEFMMGPSNSEGLRQVRIKSIFALGKYPVTFMEYERFTQAKGLKKLNDSGWGQGDHPAINMSWNDAIAYAQWLSQETGHSYRLPTEAEWEYAARAGTQTAYYWGEDPNMACEYANVHDVSSSQVNKFNWTHHACDDGFANTAPVGQFKPNRFGLYDMLGNVWEWSCSQYREQYNGQEQQCMDKVDAVRVVRSGSWGNEPNMLRIGNRVQLTPTTQNNGVGFRLARQL